MNAVIEVLYLRRPRLEYISPPACEFDFSSTGGPIIVLDALGRLIAPSGFVLGGRGRFRLSWNNYPGALCYTVYKAVDSNDPNGPYEIVAECIEDPEIDLEDDGPGCYRVSAITAHGETELSEPICGVGDCPFIISGATPSSQTVNQGQTVTISAEVGNPESTDSYVWRKNGAAYSDTTTTTQEVLQIPNAQESDSGNYTLVVSNEVCSEESAPASVTVSGGPPCSESIEIVGISALNDLSESGTVIGTQSSRPWYHSGGVSKDIRTTVDSSPITGSQSGTTITSSADFFTASDVGKVVVFSTLEQAQITAFISPLQVTVTPSQTVSSTTFILRGNTLGGPFGEGLVANGTGILAGTEDNFSSVRRGFWFDTNTNQIRDLGGPNIQPVVGKGISEDGFLLIADTSGANGRAKLYNPNTQTFTDLGDLGGPTAAADPNAMNESHVAAISCWYNPDSVFHACRSVLGVVTDIHPPEAGTNESRCIDINTSGHVVGIYTDPAPPFYTRGFVNLGGASFSIGHLGENVLPTAISDTGIVVGQIQSAGIFLPFFWTQAGGIQLIPLLPGKTNGLARDVNSAGWIVGEQLPTSIGFLYRGGITTALIDEVPSGSGWTAIATAQFINEDGQIAGRGTNSGTKRYLLQLCS